MATPERFGSGDRDRPAERQRSFDRSRPPGRSGGERDNRFAGRRESRPPVFEERRELPPQGDSDTFGSSPPSDLIWGRHSAQAALESGRPIHRVWCTAELRHRPKCLQLRREAKASGVLVEEVTWARLGQLTGGAVHQGIALQSAAAETLDLTSLIEGCREIGEAPLLMAIDGLTDPHNLGAIVRSAEALGAHGMVLPQRRSAGLTGSVAKVAAGALEHLPVARVVNLNRALDALKQEGYRVVGLAAEGTVTLEEADLTGPLVIVTGSEAEGLSMLTRRTCDQVVRIPLRGATPSLNASVATALVVYEVARRGWMRGLSGHAPAPRLVRPQVPTAVITPVVLPDTIPAAADDADELEAVQAEAVQAELVQAETPHAEAAQSEATQSEAAENDAAEAHLPGLSKGSASYAPVSEPEPEPLQPQAQDLGLESSSQAAFEPEGDEDNGSVDPDGSSAQELHSYGHPFQADITL